MPRTPGLPATILVAPDSFKGTLSAAQVAAAIGHGMEVAGCVVDLCPVADGGEGTLDALATAYRAERVELNVHDPLGRPVRAEIALVSDTAIVELAQASGLGLVDQGDRDPVAASSTGTGELIAAAIDSGAQRILVGAGGSATTDGGAAAIDAIKRAGGVRGARLTVLCDVRTPYEDAARLFGPQKGAGPEQVGQLTRRLQAQARALPRDPRGVPMTGAAGGLSGGLWAACGAELVAGAPFVLDALGFDQRMRRARTVITGEGRLDRQSLAGKALSEVASRARQAGVPCWAVVAHNELDAFELRILDLDVVLEAGSIASLRRAGAQLAQLL